MSDSDKKFSAYFEGGQNDFVHTFHDGAKWRTVVADKTTGNVTAVAPTTSEEAAKAMHEERVAHMKAGRLGEFQTEIIGEHKDD